MTTKTKSTVKAPVSPASVVFPKKTILTFQKFANRRDWLSVFLKDGECYAMNQVEAILPENKFTKGKVK